MQQRHNLRNLIKLLTIGWIFLMIEIFILLTAPDLVPVVGKIIFFIGVIILSLSTVTAGHVLDDTDYWRTLDSLNKEWIKWKKHSEEATKYKNLYMQEILDKFGMSKEEIIEKFNKK